jgi:DNA-binding LacI/PurR family transcriptional regulator
MLDVAKRAGVALSTVSYALNGTRPVAEATRLRILAAMEELDYHPNLLARSLSTKRTRIIGLFIPSDVHGTLSVMQANFVASAARVASTRGYGLLLWASAEKELDVRRMVQEGMVEGLVLMEVKLHDERVVRLRGTDYPFTLIGHCADNEGISYVDFDFVAGIRLAVGHLAELGHTSVALINYTQSVLDSGYGPAVRMADGFAAALAEYGVQGRTLPDAPNTEDTADLVCKVLVDEPELSGMIVADLSHLSAVMQAAYQLGLRIPDDLSIISILDSDVADKMAPPVTNIDFPTEAMGRIGAELLIDRLEDPRVPVLQLLLPPLLRGGQSTAKPRDRASRSRPQAPSGFSTARKGGAA